MALRMSYYICGTSYRTFVTSEQAIALAFTNYTGTLHFHTTFGQLQDRTLSTSGPLRSTSGPLQSTLTHFRFTSSPDLHSMHFQCISGPLPIHFWSNLDLLPADFSPLLVHFRPTSGPLPVQTYIHFQCISGPLPIHFWSNLDLLPVHLQPTFNPFPVNGFKKFYELKSEMSCPFNSGVFVTV